jgi:DNA-directed RNA polymerase specialized sigma24 family protein
MAIASTGLSDYEKSATSTADLGAYTIDEFCELFRISRRTAYNEARAGRLNIAKVRNRSIITKGEARRYQRALEAAA